MKKYIFIGLGVILVLLIAGGLLLMGNLDKIVKRGTERALAYILEVDVSLGSAKVTLTDGRVELRNLKIGNPEGFKTKHAFIADRIMVQADIKSFASQEPVIRKIEVDAPDLNLEQSIGKSNISQLIKNASRLQGESSKEGGGKSASQGSSEAEKNIKINQIVITNTKVGLSAPMLQGQRIAFSVPQIEMNNIGSKSNKVTAAEAVSLVFSKILEEALRAGGSLIPTDLLGDLSQPLGDVMKGLGDTGKSVGDTLKGAGEGLSGLFGKKKDN